MNRNDAAAVSLEKYRPYLHLLVRLELDPRLQGKVDLSGVVQQTLLEAHRDLDQLRDRTEAQLLAWLRRALANNLIDEIRKAGAQVRDVGRECSLQEALDESSSRLEGWLANEHSSPLQRAMQREQLAQLAAALDELPEDQRRAVELHYLKGQSLAEVATELCRSRGAVAQLVFRGLSRLRTLLQEREDS